MTFQSLQCYILDVDLQQAKVLSLSFNRANRSMEIWEEAMILSDLTSSHGLRQKSLAKLTGYSRSWVSRRLSLIGKRSDELITEIRMGALSSTQARALIKLSRGNQMEVADGITRWKLTNRQCDPLVEAYLKAKDRAEQQFILTCPASVIVDTSHEATYPPCDPRLSDFGSDLLNVSRDALSAIKYLLNSLNPIQTVTLQDIEKTIIIPELTPLSSSAQRLIEAITELQNHKVIA